jgi:hypothetical protein
MTVSISGATISGGVTLGDAGVGGSISFDGTSQYLTVPYSAGGGFDFGSQDFTIEFWMYTGGTNITKGLMAIPHNAGNYAQALWYFVSSTSLAFYSSSAGTSWDVASGPAAGTFSLNTWNHVAVSKSGSSIRLFFNGILQSTVTFAGTFTGTYDRVWIGNTSGNGNYNGLLTNIRVVKGTAVYTSNFTPPTQPLFAISGTSLLLKVASSASLVTDSSVNNLTVTNVGSATYSTSTPF